MFCAIALASPLDSQRLFTKQCQPLMHPDANDDGEVDPILAAAGAAIESPVAPKVSKKAKKAPQKEEEEGKAEEVAKQYASGWAIVKLWCKGGKRPYKKWVSPTHVRWPSEARAKEEGGFKGK